MARRSYLPLIALTALTVVVPSGSASACSCVPLSPEAVRADRRWTASLCSVTTPQGLRALAAGEDPLGRPCRRLR